MFFYIYKEDNGLSDEWKREKSPEEKQRWPDNISLLENLNDWLLHLNLPSWEGMKGCVTGRGAVRSEMILLLLGKVVSVGFEWLFLS